MVAVGDDAVLQMQVHVYRNRDDDHRTKRDLYFCWACKGWYGVPHVGYHCQTGSGFLHSYRDQCACRVCCERETRPVEGRFGFFTNARRWQPKIADLKQALAAG
jgi:hypothetical protein